MKPNDVDPANTILAARALTHGAFGDNARIGQALREVIRTSKNYPHELSAEQREALSYILGKISRIVSGNPLHLDHWLDIMGYCQKVIESIEENF